MGNPGVYVPLPSGSDFPTYYTLLESITDASGNPITVITPNSGIITISGITDASPGTDSTVSAYLFGYGVSAGLPQEGNVLGSSDAATPIDLGVKDSKGNELYSWSVTMDTAGLTPGIYALQSFVRTQGIVTTNGVPVTLFADEPDQSTVTVQEFEPFTYVVHEDTKIVSVGAAQTDTTVFLPDATYNVQISTNGRYAVWTNGDQFREDLQTGATVDLTITGGPAPALATDYNPTVTEVGTPDPYGPQGNGGYGDIAYPTFTEGGVTFGSIPDFDFNANAGSQNPLPTATDANGNTAVLTPFGSSPTMVGYATAASDNGNAVLTVDKTNVSYFTPFDSNGITASPQYYVTYRDPAPKLTIDPVNGTNQFAPGAASVTLTGTSDAIGQTVEIDFGQAGAAVGTATVQANGTWSYVFDASAIAGSSLFIEASVMSALGTPAEVSETAAISAGTPPKVTGIFGLTPENSPAFGPGEALTIYVNVSAAVTVSGNPTLTLSNGEVATFSGAPGPHTQLQFTYVPAITDPGSADLSVTGLTLSGGSSIDDANGSPLQGPFTDSLGIALQTVPKIVGLFPMTGSNGFDTPSTMPTIVVRAELGETVTVFDNGNAIGSGVTSFGGGATLLEEADITPTIALPEGQSVLTAVATDGSGRISAVSAPVTITVGTAAPDVFEDNQASANGQYLWSNAANWSEGVPVAGDAVTMAGSGIDDVAGLSLASLSLSQLTAGVDGQLSVESGLAVGALTMATSTEIDVAGSGQPDDLIITGGITVSAGAGSEPSLFAIGAGAFVGDAEANPPSLGYVVENDGTVALLGAPDAGSQLSFDGGTVELSAPGGTIAATLAGVGIGDVLELPGTSVSAVTFGATSLTVTTSAGTFDFTNVTYAPGGVGSYSVSQDPGTGLEAITFTGLDTFEDNQKAANGAYLWSNAANWSSNLPVTGDMVAMAGSGVDDIAGLTLASLTLSQLTAGEIGQLSVDAGLTVGALTMGTSTEIDVVASGQQNTLIVSGSITAAAGNGSEPSLFAIGTGAVIDDTEASAPPLDYVAENGGTVELASAPNAGSQLAFDRGTFALAAPGGTIAATLAGVGAGDVLELPGISVSAVTFGATSLTVTTSAGTFGFTNVTYAQGGVTGYTASQDAATGLEAISFTGPDGFEDNQKATTGPLSGDYLWSNAANWSEGIPVAGGAVVMAGSGVDDIAGLSLVSLNLSQLDAGAVGQLSVEDGLTVGALTMATSTEIDVVGGTLTVTGSITAPAGGGSEPSLQAIGAGALIDDKEASAPPLGYVAERGGVVELASAPNPGSQLSFGGGTFALSAPGATIAAKLAGVAVGDVLELPTHHVDSVTFGTASLTVVTDDGTFAFSNVTYDGIVDGYTTLPDDGTGLEAITFTGPDVFSATITAGTPNGFALWSNAANWSAGVPNSGNSVVMAAVGVDDIAGLSLNSLTVSPAGGGVDGQLFVQADLTVATLTVTAQAEIDLTGATLTVTGASMVDGSIFVDPSTFTFEGAVGGTGTIDIGADSTVTFDGPVAAGETVDFVSNTGTLVVGDKAQFDAKIVGSGTEIVICYLRGTCVLTPAGEVAIETLVPGDRLVTRFGGVQAIKWIGRQSFGAQFLGHNPGQWPVRIAAGALGHGRPVRDLFVSPGHSMLLDDTLVLARNLVNGISVTQSRPVSDVHYYQVEFEAQDCISAEGAWSESYADAEGLRNKFHNAGEFRDMFPAYRSPSEPQLCAPRPERGPALDVALRPIVARAFIGLTPGPLRGWVDTIEPGRVTGWAQDESHPDLPVLLDIRLHGRRLATVLACEFRGDLVEAGMGRGYNSFVLEIDLPAASLRHVTVSRAFDGAPVPAPTRHKLRGNVDGRRGLVLYGWAQNPDEPEAPVELDILIDGVPVSRVLADQFRADLRDAGLGSGRQGFEVELPALSANCDVEVRRAADLAVLGAWQVPKARAA